SSGCHTPPDPARTRPPPRSTTLRSTPRAPGAGSSEADPRSGDGPTVSRNVDVAEAVIRGERSPAHDVAFLVHGRGHVTPDPPRVRIVVQLLRLDAAPVRRNEHDVAARHHLLSDRAVLPRLRRQRGRESPGHVVRLEINTDDVVTRRVAPM